MTKPVSNPADWRCSDSLWAAQQCAAAMLDGRIELGFQLAKLARQAELYERDVMQAPAVPVDDQLPHRAGHVYQSIEPLPRPTDLASYRRAAADVDNETLEQVEAALRADSLKIMSGLGGNSWETAVMPAAEQPTPGKVTQSARCVYETAPGAICHAVVFWNETDDESRRGWIHLDMSTDHVPVVSL